MREAKFVARPLSATEEPRFVAELRPIDRAMFFLGVDGLVRLGDIFDAQWAHDKDTYLEIPDSKNGDGYKVPISRRLRAALDALSAHRPVHLPQSAAGEEGGRPTQGGSACW